METQDMCRHFRENEDSIIESADSEISLNEDKKELLKEKIAQSMDC